MTINNKHLKKNDYEKDIQYNNGYWLLFIGYCTFWLR